MSTRPSPVSEPDRGVRPGLVLGALLLALSLSPIPSLARNSGFHAGLGFGAGHIEFSPRIEASLENGGVYLDSDAAGGHLRLGYTFSPHLQLDLVFAGLDLDTGDPNVEADYGEVRFEVISHLTRRGHARPYLAGSLGGAVLGIGPDEDDLEEIGGSVASFGGGVELALGRHWGVGFDYRYGVVEFEREAVELPLQSVVIDGMARNHSWGVRFQFGF